MRLLFDIPFTEPVIIITLILVILLLSPVIFERLRIPSIVGLLISGALIGPSGFNLLPPDLEFSLLGTIGLLYLMFLAGLEIDIIDFINNKWKSIFTGLASFILPFILGFLISRYLLNFSVNASWLIGAMLASHTLISYPVLGRLGIINKSIVTIVVGATIIADILALVAMELITNFAEKGFNWNEMMLFGLHFLLFFIVVLFIFPKISRIFLNKYEGDLGLQYIFVLVILFLSAFVALILDIEPIIGAFFSGLVLNRLIFKNSPLYKRTEFIGNNLFIPFFIISIGLLANFKIFLDEPKQIGITLILILTAFVSKYLAAWLSKVFLKFSNTEKNLIFGMSLSRAASAIAIILIGFNMGIISETVLNNTVILILVTSVSSSYITQRAGKKLLVEEETISEDYKEKQKILIPLANPSNMVNLLEFASLIKKEDNNLPVYPLTIFTNQSEVRDKIDKNHEEIAQAVKTLHSDVIFENSTRIDNNVTNGIVRAAEEVVATTIVMGWNKSKTPFYILFGNVLNNLLDKTERMVMVLKTPSSFRKVKKIDLWCPENAQFEKGFHLWLETISFFIKKLQLKVNVDCSSAQTIEAIKQFVEKNGNLKYFNIQQNEEILKLNENIRNTSTELLVFVHSRKKTISYNKTFEHVMNNRIARFDKNNIVIIYPEQ